MRYHESGERAPIALRQQTVAESWEQIRSYTTPIARGIHSYLPDGRPLYGAFATGFQSGSFKERGGIGKTMMLADAGYDEAVLYSAGNHLSGSAYGTRPSGLLVHGFVPDYAPQVKIDLSQELAGDRIDVRRVMGDLALARTEAYKLAKKLNVPVIEPFDDADIARFQGTILYEYLLQNSDIDIVVMPEGGGGLEAGCLQVIREMGLNIKVYGAKLSSDFELCEGAYVEDVGAIAHQARADNPQLWGSTLYVDPADVGAMVALEDATRAEDYEAMGLAAYKDYPESTALLAAAAVHKYHESLPGNVLVLITGSNADHTKLDKLHDHYKASQQKLGRVGFQMASGYQLRNKAA